MSSSALVSSQLFDALRPAPVVRKTERLSPLAHLVTTTTFRAARAQWIRVPDPP